MSTIEQLTNPYQDLLQDLSYKVRLISCGVIGLDVDYIYPLTQICEFVDIIGVDKQKTRDAEQFLWDLDVPTDVNRVRWLSYDSEEDLIADLDYQHIAYDALLICPGMFKPDILECALNGNYNFVIVPDWHESVERNCSNLDAHIPDRSTIIFKKVPSDKQIAIFYKDIVKTLGNNRYDVHIY